MGNKVAGHTLGSLTRVNVCCTELRTESYRDVPAIREFLLQLLKSSISGRLNLEIVGSLVIGKDHPIYATDVDDILVRM